MSVTTPEVEQHCVLNDCVPEEVKTILKMVLVQQKLRRFKAKCIPCAEKYKGSLIIKCVSETPSFKKKREEKRGPNYNPWKWPICKWDTFQRHYFNEVYSCQIKDDGVEYPCEHLSPEYRCDDCKESFRKRAKYGRIFAAINGIESLNQ